MGGRDDSRRGDCRCVFMLGLLVVDLCSSVRVRCAGGGGKEEDIRDDRDVGL